MGEIKFENSDMESFFVSYDDFDNNHEDDDELLFFFLGVKCKVYFLVLL
jgi:hypothetical protein